MRILLNDYAGHPFQIQLSRELAARGHDVLHTFCSSVKTPRGSLKRLPFDPDSLRICPIPLAAEFNKYGLVKRWRQERELGRQLASAQQRFRADVVLSANTPLGAQAALLRATRKAGAGFVFWLQDVLGVGIRKALTKRLGAAGALLGRYFEHYERRLLNDSDSIVAISRDFLRYIPSPTILEKRIHVIQNWAPLTDLPVTDKNNPWSIAHSLSDKFCFLYSGTLGLKHNPALLSALASRFRTNPNVAVVVIAEGPGADFLRAERTRLHLDNLFLFSFLPFADMPDALGTADVLVGLLERDAGAFAVPSKILTYLCAQRPLLLSVPQENLAAQVVKDAAAGIVTEPGDDSAFLNAADTLLQETSIRTQFSANGRRYAEETFDIGQITDRFETILEQSSTHPLSK